MCLKILLFSEILISALALAQVPEGIPRELARQRAAQISDVRYELQFALDPKATTVRGHEVLRFSLREKPAHDLLLDYRDGVVSRLSANDSINLADQAQNGHLLLPMDSLRAGANAIEIAFTSNVAPAGKPFIRYHDKDDGSQYIYTLFVPMDASMAFPCFDQPDLKARFTVRVTAPQDWTVISNTGGTVYPTRLARHTDFAETAPIPTYLFAFAAGPFKKLESPGLPTLYVRQSKFARAQAEATEVQQIAQQGIDYLSKYFAQSFPFPKYDMVLIPGMAYGGMEHAGATFLREESVLFRTAPTKTDLLGRDILTLHELTHQWFGDFTTMRWFDDLWLKEGFAQYMAYRALAGIRPDEAETIWKRFYETIKPAAYAIDSTKGTTPIYQDIPNLKDAKSAYGAIVYSKAPGVLKQLAFVLGDEHFRDGLRIYLKEHAYGNAEWSDLVKALERSSGQKLDRWAEMWIKHRGMPQVDVQWGCKDGKLTQFMLTQHDVLNEGGVWPIAMELELYNDNSDSLRVELNSVSQDVPKAVGQRCPMYVFANDSDRAYGRFLLDENSRSAVFDQVCLVVRNQVTTSCVYLEALQNPFKRALLWGSLWEGVRVADFAPRDYIALATKLLPDEKDESLAQSIIARTATALHRYVSPELRRKLAQPLEILAIKQMTSPQLDVGLRIIWFRGLRQLAETNTGRQALKDLLSGKLTVPGVELRPLDRWNMVTALVALNDPEADKYLAAERERDHSGDGLKYAYVAEAARPDAANKKKYFDDYLHNPQRPEDWVEQSLGAFNYWNQPELTEPYLKPALEALPQVKRERKIFFLVGWLDAFIGGQISTESDAAVHQFLSANKLDHDVELKILQAVDELDRTVAIRKKFPE
jgi:aminopeptidase N